MMIETLDGYISEYRLDTSGNVLYIIIILIIHNKELSGVINVIEVESDFNSFTLDLQYPLTRIS